MSEPEEHNSAESQIARKQAAVVEAHGQAITSKAEGVRTRAQLKAEQIRLKAEIKAKRVIAKGEIKAAKIEGIDLPELDKQKKPRKIRYDVHGRPKPAMRGWIHAVAAPLSLAAGIVLICLAKQPGLKWACAVFMVSSLILFTNSAAYHLGDWNSKVTNVLRRIDHVNIFLLIAGTYTPVAFALQPFWRNTIIINVIWTTAPRWLYTLVYVIFGIYGLAYMVLFWTSPVAGPVVTILIIAGGVCYIAGAIVYARRSPDPWPRVFGFHEIFHCGTVAGYACHMVAIYMVIVNMWTMMP